MSPAVGAANASSSVRREYQHRRDGTEPKCLTCRRPAVATSEAEREKYVAWWLYESGLEVDKLVAIATTLVEEGGPALPPCR